MEAVMSEKKQAVITFKAEGEMLAALNKISNKSEFIRAAVLNALDETCPFCGGAGFLNEKQRKHWKTFAKFHTLKRCRKCDAADLECRHHEHNDDEECCR